MVTPRWYAVPEPADRLAAERACLAMLDIVRPRCGSILIDAYGDYRDSLDPRAAAAQRSLRERGAGRRSRVLHRPADPGMAIELDPTDETDWALLRDYAAWSIHVELSEGFTRETVAILHDCGDSVTGKLTETRQRGSASRPAWRYCQCLGVAADCNPSVRECD